MGIANIRPRPGNDFDLPRWRGAFVNVVGLAKSASAFASLTRDYCERNGVRLYALTDVQPLDSREAVAEASEDIEQMLGQLSERQPLLFHWEIDTYPRPPWLFWAPVGWLCVIWRAMRASG